MIPVWSNPLVAIDIRTTGPDPERHEICQLAAVKLNSEFKPAVGTAKLSLTIVPDSRISVDDAWLKKTSMPYQQLVTVGCSQLDASRIWKHWHRSFSSFPLLVLAYRWHCTAPFLLKFAGVDTFAEPIRDLQGYITYVHDRHWFAQYNPGFTSFTLKKIYECCQVPCLDMKDPLLTCLANAECFRRLLTHKLP